MMEFRLEDGSKLVLYKSPDTEEYLQTDALLKFRKGLTRNLVSKKVPATDPRVDQVVQEDADDFIESIIYAYGLDHMEQDFLNQVKKNIVGEMFAMFNTEFAGLSESITNLGNEDESL